MFHVIPVELAPTFFSKVRLIADEELVDVISQKHDYDCLFQVLAQVPHDFPRRVQQAGQNDYVFLGWASRVPSLIQVVEQHPDFVLVLQMVLQRLTKFVQNVAMDEFCNLWRR